MDCSRFRELIEDHIDDMLAPETRAQLLEHAASCPACGEELRRAEALKEALRGFDDEIFVPLSAQAGWRAAVKKEAGRRRIRRFMRAAGAVAAAFAVMVGTTFAFRGAGLLEPRSAEVMSPAAEMQETVYYTGERLESAPLMKAAAPALETDGEEPELYLAMEDAPLTAGEAAAQEEAFEVDSADAGAPELDEEALLARSAYREIYTDDFDAVHAQVAALSEEYGGYLKSDAVSIAEGVRTAELVASVPADDLDGYLAALDYLGTVTQTSTKLEDVTLTYYDAQGRLEALALEKDRLEALIGEGKDAAELAALQEELENVFARMDTLESESRGYMAAVENAEVRVSLREGEPGAAGAAPEEKLGQRMSGGFKGTLKSLRRFFGDMAVSLAVLAPVALIALPAIAVIWILIALLVRRRRRAQDER